MHLSKSPHKNLEAWKNAMVLVEKIYMATQSFPKEEQFGLISQMRRAAVSIPSNIAEGAADRSKKQFSNFLSISLGSLAELDTQVELSRNLHYIEETTHHDLSNLIDKTKGLVFGLKKSLLNGH